MATALSKPRFDKHFTPRFPDTLDLLSERDINRYRLQRRLVGPAYQTTSLIRHEAAVDEVLQRAVAKLKSLNGSQVELSEWMHMIAVECLGAVVLSWSPNMFKNGHDWGTGIHAYHSWRRKSVLGLFPAMVKLEFISKTAGRLFSTAWGVNYKTPRNFRPFFPVSLFVLSLYACLLLHTYLFFHIYLTLTQDVGRRISRRIKFSTRPNPPKDNRQDLMADLIQLHKIRPAFTDTYLRKMAMTNFGAGHETMASTFTSLFAMLGSHHDLQARVYKEVSETVNSSDYAIASRLPLTQALIKECKRLYPVVSMSLPRRVPSSGLTLHKFFFPPNTTVGCNPVALHRNKDVFGPDAELFNIERWLGDDLDRLRNMERVSLSWGGGQRSCPGRHLAELVVYKIVPALVKEFRIEAVLPPEDEGRSYFLSMLTGVKTRFVARDKATT